MLASCNHVCEIDKLEYDLHNFSTGQGQYEPISDEAVHQLYRVVNKFALVSNGSVLYCVSLYFL